MIKDFDAKKSQYILLEVDLKKTLAEHEKLTLKSKKEYDEAKAAEALAQKLLTALRIDNKNLEQLLLDTKTDLTKEALKNAKLAALLADHQTEKKTLTRELKEKTAQYVLIRLDLDKVLAEKTKLSDLTIALKKDYDDAKAAEALAKKAGDELARLLAVSKIDFKNLTESVSKTKEADLAKLAENARLIAELNEKIKKAEIDLATVNIALQKLKKDAMAAGVKIDETKVSLQDALVQNLKLQTLADQLQADLKQAKTKSDLLDQENARLRTAMADIKKRHDNLALDYETLRSLNTLSGKDLENAVKSAEKLKLENLSMQEKMRLIRLSVQNRFAGITLTGNKVIFLVDMSGSMEFVDEDTKDPDKWPLVCDTVGRVMLSLPDLKQYQIIMFAGGVTFPLGSKGVWLDYEGQKTVDATVKKLKSIKPNGGTNIHGAFAEVFAYRKLGLDTVYFFSDGLPTSGEGLPAASKQLSEREKTEILSAHVRKTLKNTWNRPIPSNPRVRINTIGFFYESPDVGAFLWALAREHDGSFVGMSKP